MSASDPLHHLPEQLPRAPTALTTKHEPRHAPTQDRRRAAAHLYGFIDLLLSLSTQLSFAFPGWTRLLRLLLLIVGEGIQRLRL